MLASACLEFNPEGSLSYLGQFPQGLLKDLSYQMIEWALQKSKQDRGEIIFLPFFSS